MSWSTIVGLVLSLLSKKDQVLEIVNDALALYNKLRGVIPGLGKAAPSTAGPSNSQTEFTIQWLQESLNTLVQAGLKVDGSYGKGTQDAVKKFQQANGLTPDGWAGVETQAAIASALK